MITIKDLLALVACVCTFIPSTGCSRKMPIVNEASFPRNEVTDLNTIQRAKRLVVYEGLPDPVDDRYEREKQTNKTVRHHDYDFYFEPLELPPDVQRQLRIILASPATFEEDEEPLCVFHPDFMVEWEVDEKVFQLQICFGCHVVRVIAPDGGERYHIGDTAYNELKTLLVKHGQHFVTADAVSDTAAGNPE